MADSHILENNLFRRKFEPWNVYLSHIRQNFVGLGQSRVSLLARISGTFDLNATSSTAPKTFALTKNLAQKNFKFHGKEGGGGRQTRHVTRQTTWIVGFFSLCNLIQSLIRVICYLLIFLLFYLSANSISVCRSQQVRITPIPDVQDETTVNDSTDLEFFFYKFHWLAIVQSSAVRSFRSWNNRWLVTSCQWWNYVSYGQWFRSILQLIYRVI